MWEMDFEFSFNVNVTIQPMDFVYTVDFVDFDILFIVSFICFTTLLF